MSPSPPTAMTVSSGLQALMAVAGGRFCRGRRNVVRGELERGAPRFGAEQRQ